MAAGVAEWAPELEHAECLPGLCVLLRSRILNDKGDEQRNREALAACEALSLLCGQGKPTRPVV